MSEFIQVLTYASIGGIIPCLFWLIFWLREDSFKPEPPRLILACFVGGMIVTLLVFPVQFLVSLFTGYGAISLIAFAFIEEIAKFVACYFIALRSKYNDEPIDAVIYMVTVALGFAALENTIYLISPLLDGDAFAGAMMGNLRFIGASLVHVLSSAVVGSFIAFAFYKKKLKKEEYLLAGVISAGVLHTLFNFFILDNSGAGTFLVFATVWLLIMALIVVLEKIKTITFKNI